LRRCVAAAACHPDRINSRRRDRVRLVEREEIVEIRVAGRGNAGGMGQRRKNDATGAHRDNAPPVDRKTGGRRLEGDGRAGDWRPYVPEGERRRHMRVLNWLAVACQPRPNRVVTPLETERHEPRVAEQRSIAAPRTRAVTLLVIERRSWVVVALKSMIPGPFRAFRSNPRK